MTEQKVSEFEFIEALKIVQMRSAQWKLRKSGECVPDAALADEGGIVALCGASGVGGSWIALQIIYAAAAARMRPIRHYHTAEVCGLEVWEGSGVILPYTCSMKRYGERLQALDRGDVGIPSELYLLSNPPELMREEEGVLVKTAEWESLFKGIRKQKADYVLIDAVENAVPDFTSDNCARFLRELKVEAEAGGFIVLLVSSADAVLSGKFQAGVDAVLCLERAASGAGVNLCCDKAKYCAGDWSVELKPQIGERKRFAGFIRVKEGG